MDHEVPSVYRSVGFAQRAAGMGCEIVAYGDSTALADFVPAEIEAKTGMKTCNVSEFRSIGDFMGINFALDAYLAHNPPPKFIVAGFTPTNFYLNHPPLQTLNPEDFLYGLRYDPGPWLWKSMLRHPAASVTFLAWIEKTMVSNLTDPATSSAAANDDRERRDRSAGNWSIRKPPQTHCTGLNTSFPESSYEQNERGVAAFRAHYHRPGTTTLVVVTPVADCDPQLGRYASLTRGLTDNELEVLPISSFNDQDIHLDHPAAVRWSGEIAEEILARQARSRPASIP